MVVMDDPRSKPLGESVIIQGIPIERPDDELCLRGSEVIENPNAEAGPIKQRNKAE
jgi:hypothetical protein